MEIQARMPTTTAAFCLMRLRKAETYRFNPFDLAKVGPQGDYPLHAVGQNLAVA